MIIIPTWYPNKFSPQTPQAPARTPSFLQVVSLSQPNNEETEALTVRICKRIHVYLVNSCSCVCSLLYEYL